MSDDLIGARAAAWAARAAGLPAGSLPLLLADVDGVITRGEGQPAELSVLEHLARINRAARDDPCVPAIALCTGRQAPYVELMAQTIETFLPCIFEHGAGLFFPLAFRYAFDTRLGPDYAARLARVRAALDEPLLRAGRAFVQPGKEATMTLYPLGGTSVEDLFAAAARLVAHNAPDWETQRNVRGVEVRPRGIDKGRGAEQLGRVLGIRPTSMAGVGDSEPDLSFLGRVAFSGAPANAAPVVRSRVHHVARAAYGVGLLELVDLVEQRNRAVC